MSKRLFAKRPLVAPANLDEEFIKRLDYEDPFAKASIWLHKLMIRRIHDIDAVAAHYADGDCRFGPDEEPISQLLNQEDGTFCDRFRYYCEMIVQYEQGQVPKHLIETDLRVFGILIERLKRHAETLDNIRIAQREVKELFRLSTVRDEAYADKSRFEDRIFELRKSIVDVFGRIGDDFYRQENAGRKHSYPKPATKEDVAEIVRHEVTPIKTTLAKVDETTSTINNRDKKYRRKSKARFTVEQQDGIYRQWMIAKKDQSVKSIAKHKPGYEAAIIQFRREFKAYGAMTAEDLKAALKARINRLRYS